MMREFQLRNAKCETPVACGLAGGSCASPAKPQAAGVTLLELLIVIVILTTLVAAAIPLMSPATDARRIREAARGLNTYISSAQAKAVRTGRPVGIYLKRLSADTGSDSDRGVCLEVYQVEQPPSFAGFSESSMARVALNFVSGTLENIPGEVKIQFVARGNFEAPGNDGLPFGWDKEGIPPGFFRQGDVIEIGEMRYQFTDIGNLSGDAFDPGGFYKPLKGDGSIRESLIARVLNDTGKVLHVVHDDLGNRLPPILPRQPNSPPPPHYWTEPARYKILRQPSLTSAEPLQLPEGTAIDLMASGAPLRFGSPIDNKPRLLGALHTPPNQSNPDDYGVANPINNDDPIIVMFTPEGSIERLRMRLDPGLKENVLEQFNEPITDNFFLLIGLRANIPSEINDYATTFSPLSSFSQEELAEGRTKVNWLNLESRWVVIGAQTGTVATVENAAADPFAIQALVEGNTPEPVFQRAYEINKAREFARELTRTGGR